MKQRQYNTFAGGEAKEWMRRNKKKIKVKDDPVLHSMELLRIKPKSLLEVGCADGWRMRELKRLHPKCIIAGIDPGGDVHRKDTPPIVYGGAHSLVPFKNGAFDVVIYGFCLYLCDRDDLFRIAMEGDRVLKDGGHIIVYDFYAPRPKKVPYKHHKGVFSYHFDYGKLWDWSRDYHLETRQLYGDGDDLTEVVVLQKNQSTAWPEQ